MDCTLATLNNDECMHEYRIVKAVVEAVFHACVALNKDNLVDTGRASILQTRLSLTSIDMKPDKIMISNIESANPIIKIEDLGLGEQALLHLT